MIFIDTIKKDIGKRGLNLFSSSIRYISAKNQFRGAMRISII